MKALFVILCIALIGCTEKINEPELESKLQKNIDKINIILEYGPELTVKTDNYIVGITAQNDGDSIIINAVGSITFRDIMEGFEKDYWIALKFNLCNPPRFRTFADETIKLKYKKGQQSYWYIY